GMEGPYLGLRLAMRAYRMGEPPLRILLVEDDPAYAELTRAMLRTTSGTAVILDHTTSVHAAVDRLADTQYDIVLLDLGLPDAQELEALNSLVGAAPDLPLVILTGTENEVRSEERRVGKECRLRWGAEQ